MSRGPGRPKPNRKMRPFQQGRQGGMGGPGPTSGGKNLAPRGATTPCVIDVRTWTPKVKQQPVGQFLKVRTMILHAFGSRSVNTNTVDAPFPA